MGFDENFTSGGIDSRPRGGRAGNDCGPGRSGRLPTARPRLLLSDRLGRLGIGRERRDVLHQWDQRDEHQWGQGAHDDPERSGSVGATRGADSGLGSECVGLVVLPPGRRQWCVVRTAVDGDAQGGPLPRARQGHIGQEGAPEHRIREWQCRSDHAQSRTGAPLHRDRQWCDEDALRGRRCCPDPVAGQGLGLWDNGTSLAAQRHSFVPPDIGIVGFLGLRVVGEHIDHGVGR